MAIVWQRYCILCILVILIGCVGVSPCAADQQISKKNITLEPGKFSFIPYVQSTEGSMKNTHGTLNDATVYTTDTIQSLTGNSPGYVPGQVIVRYMPAGTLADQSGRGLSSRLNTEAGAVSSTPLSLMGVSDAELVSLPAGADVQSAIAVYEKNPAVLYAQPNYLYRFVSLPDDPSFGLQWGLQNTGQYGGTAGADISAPDAWNISTGSDAVIIAVSDTGVDYNHPDLKDNIWINAGENGTDTWGNDKRSNGIDDELDGYTDDWNGWNFYFHNNDTMDYEGHGTHVSGIIGAVGNNSEGISGITWKVKIMPLDISMRNGGYLDTVSAVQGFDYAKNHGAKIISCSWGGYGDSSYLRDAIRNNPDVLFVFAAGNDANDNDKNPFIPASYPYDNIISVAASDTGDNLAWFSNYGLDSVDLAAPGYIIYSTYPSSSGSFQYMSGTSMATPHVAGVAGLIRGMHPGFSPVQIKQAILENADVKSPFIGKVKTAGRLNAYHALFYPDVPFSANFTATPAQGRVPLTVRFTDTSVGDPDAWNWSFGTGDVSSLQNPEYNFTRGGIFTVTLIVSNSTTGRSGATYHTVRAFSGEPGVSWVEATDSAAFSPRDTHTAVVFNNSIWVIGGSRGGDVKSAYVNDTWYSSDGVNWTQATGAAAFSGRCCHSSVVYDGRMWVLNGFSQDGISYYLKDDVWYSNDGVNWTQATASAPFSGRWGQGAVVFDNKIWVIGGVTSPQFTGFLFMNDVWYSEDGVNWTQATASAAFPARYNYGLVVFDNKMWIIGGYNYGGLMNDVWYSDDGINWTQATGSAAFSPRCQHTSVIYDDRMWIIAGYDGNLINDIWYSEDGVNWTQATSSAQFLERDTAASVVFDNRMWEIGGFVGSPYYMYNDVWYSPPYSIPTANFTARPRQGIRPLTVQFNDTSGNGPARWHWDFGDNSTSDKQNPRHQYSIAGKYNVSLTAANPAGSNTTTKVRYINVTKPVPPATPAPPVYSSRQPDEPDSSDKAVRLTSLVSTRNARQGSVITLTFDQNITPEYPVAFSRIQFVPDNDIGELEAIVHDVRPGDILEVPGCRVAGYERVELVGVNPRLVLNGSVLFQVAGSWLMEEKATPSDIVLMRYHDNAWEELSTRFDHPSGGSYYFIATTPGFSYFAVTVRPEESMSAPFPASVTALPVAQPLTSVSSPVRTTAVPPTTVITQTTQPAPAPSQSSGPGAPVPIVFAVTVIVAVAGGFFWIRRRWIRRQNPALFREYD
jgi:PGF-pre-PGF domain-containing protein